MRLEHGLLQQSQQAASEDASVPRSHHAKLLTFAQGTLDALGHEAMTRDPERFEVLVDGGAGIGGLYDLWRRLLAALRGRPFDPAHRSAT